MEADRMILGEGITYTTDSDITGLNDNVIVCGGSGSGKTMSYSEIRLLETYGSSCIVPITKRKLYYRYKPLFKSRGYEVWDWNMCEPHMSNIGFDLMQGVSSYADIRFLAESIVKSNPQKYSAKNVDPYWDDGAISLLCAEISYIIMTKRKPTFLDVLRMHDGLEFKENGSLISTSYDEAFENLEKTAPECLAVSCWKTFRMLPAKTAACIFSTLNATMDTIFNPEMRAMMKIDNKIDFKQLASRKTVLFVTTSPVNNALNCFVNIFYARAFKALFEYAERCPSGQLPIPVHILCDDFATGSKIQNFPEYISVIREKLISVSILIQSESQLESMYDKDATTIINNCDTYVYLGGMDLKTCKNISERLNIPLEDVLYMPIGQEYVFRRGQKPVKTTRYNIRNDERYQKITAEYEKSREVR